MPIRQTGLSTDQLTTIGFIDGLTTADQLAPTSFWTWDGGTIAPFTYTGTESAHKFGGGTAGAAGGTVTFSFAPASMFSDAEKSLYRGALTILSSECNVTFQEAASGGTVLIERGMGNDRGGVADTTYTAGTVGASTIPATTAGTLSVNTAVGATPSFSNGSYAISTIVHEFGHILGLGHSGPYNGNLNRTTQQNNATDTLQYSIMSYIYPTDTDARYYASYSAAGTDWRFNGGSVSSNPVTPQQLDILALQQLYGAPSGGVFTGGQTFGFNTNLTGDVKPFFDFTTNIYPVLTLYDTGANNVLDLSGFTSSDIVDLNPGSFSSVTGLVNDIGIAYGTRIDGLLGASGGGTFTVNADSDTITGTGGTNTVVFKNNGSLSGAFANWTLFNDGTVVSATQGTITDRFRGIQTLQFTDRSIATTAIACFAQGTTILTSRGEIAVEHLSTADQVLTLGRGFQPVIWIGNREIDPAHHADPATVWPVRIRAHAFGPGLPHHDLFVSPEHAIGFEGSLIPARLLANGASVRQERVDRVCYFHVELPHHAMILAQGLPAESWLDTGNRSMFANAPVAALIADMTRERGSADAWAADACAPLIADGPILERARALLDRAPAVGVGPFTAAGSRSAACWTAAPRAWSRPT